MPQKILIMYLNAGGGHRSAALALQERLHLISSDANVVLVDVFKNAPRLLNWLFTDGYEEVITNHPWLWRLVYGISKWRPIMALELVVVKLMSRKILAEIIGREQPSQIIIDHFILVATVLDIMEKLPIQASVKVMVTDIYSGHPYWFFSRNRVTEYLVFSEKMRTFAIQCGVSESKIKVFPPLLQLKYASAKQKYDNTTLWGKYGLTSGRPVVLITGGGGGLPKAALFLDSFIKSKIDCDFVVVCGNSQIMRQQIEQVKASNPQMNIISFDFVNFLDELIVLSDVVVTKAGPAIIWESLMLYRPLLLVYAWEQEKGNADFVVDNNLGEYQPNPHQAALSLQSLLYDANKKSAWQAAWEKVNLAIDDGAIARHLLK